MTRFQKILTKRLLACYSVTAPYPADTTPLRYVCLFVFHGHVISLVMRNWEELWTRNERACNLLPPCENRRPFQVFFHSLFTAKSLLHQPRWWNRFFLKKISFAIKYFRFLSCVIDDAFHVESHNWVNLAFWLFNEARYLKWNCVLKTRLSFSDIV